MMCFGLFFTFSALMVTGGKSKQAGEEEQASQIAAAIEDENEGKQPLLEVEEMNGEKKSTKDMHVYPITTGTIVFQALLTAAAIYYAMLLTNWGNPVFLNSSYNFFTPGSKTSYWCQLSAMWVSFGIYLFSMLAPLCFPGRNFG